MYYQHPWNEEEVRNCYKEAYDQEVPENRFAGLLLPFIGGLIVGGLFIPKINNQPPQQYPYYQAPPYPYPSYQNTIPVMPYPYNPTN